MDTAIIALISTLVLSIIANVAAWWQLANQAKKDKEEAALAKRRVELEEDKAELDKETVTQAAALAMIQTQREQIDRLEKRGLELENMVIAKTTENSELKLTAIDKEAELRTLKYQLKLLKPVSEEKPLKSDIKGFKSTLLPEEIKNKVMITKLAGMEIRKIRENSISQEMKEN
jgi:hypothetical protein